MSYQGWKNYETWAVKLWIDNEEPQYSFWNDQTANAWADAEYGNDSNMLTRSDYARMTLAGELKEWAESNAPDLGANFYTDLLNAALSEVDWTEIANNMLSDIEGYENAE